MNNVMFSNELTSIIIMNQECYPTLPSTNSSTRKLRLKIITSNGRRFICPISYQCTVEELADRILKVYAQFQKDPAHRYYAADGLVAKRVYNIRSHSYYLGRMDHVGDLLNDLDQIECDVEETTFKEKHKQKHKKLDKKKKDKKKRERSQQQKGKDRQKEKSPSQKVFIKQKVQKFDKNQIVLDLPSIPKINQQGSSVKKMSFEVNESDRKSPFLKPRLLQPDVACIINMNLQNKVTKQNRQQCRSPPFPIRKLTSPRINALQSDKIQKFSLNKQPQRIKPQTNNTSDKKSRQQVLPKQHLLKELKGAPIKQVLEKKDNNTVKEGKKNQNNEEQGVSRRKKSCVVVQSQQQKQSAEIPKNIYTKSYIQSNKRKIFNRFDDDSD